MGSDVKLLVGIVTRSEFQSTLPHGERQEDGTCAIRIAVFQSTLPHGERLFKAFLIALTKKFQSTLPHGERPAVVAALMSVKEFQSTLPHGERPVECNVRAPFESFQSTLPHGERPVPTEKNGLVICFNPRSHMGSDAKLLQRFFELYVSIHAPTWGATISIKGKAGAERFQSTLPHGERLHILNNSLLQ